MADRDPSTGDLGAEVATFAALLVQRDSSNAKRLALQLLDGGVPLSRLFTELVAPAQAEVGDRWHRNELSVAAEHAATAVADDVVSALTVIGDSPVGRPHVVLACAEGEWHVLPARLTAESLRSEGFSVTFLGPSTPARHLPGFLEDVRPDVLAVSCSTALSLDGVLRFVHVAHDAGVPVIAGGRGLSVAQRAYTLGVDLWAPDAAAAGDVLRQPLPRALREPTADTGGAMALAPAIGGWVERALVALADRFPALAHYDDEQLARTREDFGYIIHFIQAAILLRDSDVFHEFTDWLRLLLEARGVPAAAFRLSLEALTATRPESAPAALLDSAQVRMST